MLHSDAFAWNMEKDPVLRSTVVAILRLDRPPDWQTLRSRIDRLTRLVPALRQRVQAPPWRIGPLRWSVDDDFDLNFHLRRAQLAAPGGWAQVLEFARTAAMDDFDRARPLWEFTLLDGMSDGGSALVTKLHHALTDGIGGLQLAALVIDAGPDSPRLGPMPPRPQGHPLSTAGLTARTVGDEAAEVASVATRMLRSAPGGMVGALRHPAATAKGIAATTVSVGRIVAPVNRQLSKMLGQRGIRRRLATMDVPFAELHAAARAADAHVNDAYLAALIGGVHRYHRLRDQPLRELRVTVPVSVRGASDEVGGNRITLIRVRFQADIEDPAERIRHVAGVMRRWRHEPALAHTQPIAFGLNLVPRPYLGSIFKRIELLASDVPGLKDSVWLAGARMTGYYPFGPTIGSAVNATLMSYAGTCNIGINIDLDAIDDPELLLSCLRDGVEEVLAIGAEAR